MEAMDWNFCVEPEALGVELDQPVDRGQAQLNHAPS